MTILFSDRSIPHGHRHMNGYSSHTFSLINAAGELFYCKWHFKTEQGIKNVPAEMANVVTFVPCRTMNRTALAGRAGSEVYRAALNHQHDCGDDRAV
jgi:hypothetical protein